MNFNESQLKAIQHKDGPMLVLAGPGSGKTKTLVERTKHLILEHGIHPSNILVIIFTKAAANEMKQRFLAEMEALEKGKDYKKVSFGTFHAIFFMILKQAYHYEVKNIIREEEKRQIVRESIYSIGLDDKDENELITGILGEISMVKNTRISLEHFYSAQCGSDIFRKIYKDYETFLRRNRRIDFDDMLLQTYELFKERTDILQAWQKKYTYILVDEFQDISPLQYDIVRMLALPENHLFMVGDDDQSIYRFRGSKPELMLHVPEDFPGIPQVQLNINYRCPPKVIEAAQKLISYNTKRFLKTVTAHRSESKAVIYRHFSNQQEEILYILKSIEQQLKTGLQLSDMAVLFRTNMQPRFLIEQLFAYNIDFKTKEQIPNLFEHWIAKDIRVYMDIARGSRARKDFFMIMNKPKRYISRESLYEREVDFETWEKYYEKQPWIAERIAKLHRDMEYLKQMSPYAAINYIRHGIGYDDYIKDYANYRNIPRTDVLEILEELQASAKGFRTYEDWELHMQEYTKKLRENAGEKQENTNAITLATMHSAKGLEFSSVFILDANEGITPYKKAVLDCDMEEERRLFYVAMTRAISDLTICSVASLHHKAAEPSRFLEEAGLIEVQKDRKHK